MTMAVCNSISECFQENNINAIVRDFVIFKRKSILVLQTPISTEVRVGDVFDCLKRIETYTSANKLFSEIDVTGNCVITIWELIKE
jgi:hypothetical protein